MQLIDANVILRYLLNDSETMSMQAKRAVESGAYTTFEVIAEVVYVLKGVYHAGRSEIREWLTLFLDDIILENKPVMLYALRTYGETTLDFVDCILIAYNRVLGRKIFSFDKKLNRCLIIDE